MKRSIKMAKSLESAKLYVGCGLTNAPEEFKEGVEQLKDRLKKHYDVFDFVGLTAGTAEDVYRWDIEHCVADCDLFVGVCDYPSIGLGWELNEAIDLYKPTLGVAHEKALVTRLVLGAAAVKPNFTFQRYNDLALEVPAFVEEQLMVAQNKLSVPEIIPVQ
jgi:hypothetical protein